MARPYSFLFILIFLFDFPLAHARHFIDVMALPARLDGHRIDSPIEFIKKNCFRDPFYSDKLIVLSVADIDTKNETYARCRISAGVYVGNYVQIEYFASETIEWPRTEGYNPVCILASETLDKC